MVFAALGAIYVMPYCALGAYCCCLLNARHIAGPVIVTAKSRMTTQTPAAQLKPIFTTASVSLNCRWAIGLLLVTFDYCHCVRASIVCRFRMCVLCERMCVCACAYVCVCVVSWPIRRTASSIVLIVNSVALLAHIVAAPHRHQMSKN